MAALRLTKLHIKSKPYYRGLVDLSPATWTRFQLALDHPPTGCIGFDSERPNHVYTLVFHYGQPEPAPGAVLMRNDGPMQ